MYPQMTFLGLLWHVSTMHSMTGDLSTNIKNGSREGGWMGLGRIRNEGYK